MKKLILLLIFSAFIYAQSFALLIGVQKYKSVSPLIGIEHDIKHMQQILQLLKVNDIKVIRDKQATLKSVRGALQEYINSNKNRKGNIFIFYFSGHGVRVADTIKLDESEDGKDEAMALYDIDINDTIIKKGVLLDDELRSLLSKIKSKKIVILDDCHSSTSTRAVLDYAKVICSDCSLSKSFIEDIQKNIGSKLPPVLNTIELSACKADQTAEASPMGSLFTLALYDAIVLKQVGKLNSVTLKELEQFCKRDIANLTKLIEQKYPHSGIKAFQPVFKPNSQLHKPFLSLFQIISVDSNKIKPPSLFLEDTLDSLVSISVVTIESDKKSYSDGQSIDLKITTQKDGYLTIFVAQKSRYRLFLQNKKVYKNKTLRFPNKESVEKLYAMQDNREKTKIYAILSKEKINIDAQLLNINKQNYKIFNSLRKELLYIEKYKKLNKPHLKQANKIIAIGKVEFEVK